MLRQEICPECGDLIAAERMDEDLVICECGYTRSSAQKKFYKAQQKKSSYTIILLSLFLVSSFIHTAKWGTDSITVTPLEASRVFGTISPEQALKLGDLHFEKNYFDQAEKMYRIFLETSPKNIDANKKLGTLLFRQEKYAESIPFLETYFLEGGDDKLTLFSYGKALTNTEDLGVAEEVFLQLLKQRPEIYQTTVVQALVDLYITQGQLIKAKKFISELIHPGYEVPGHLREQKSHLEELIKKRS